MEHFGQRGPTVRVAEQASGEDGTQGADGVGAIVDARWVVGPVIRQVLGGQQAAEVVGQYLGVEVLLQGQVVEAGNCFEVETMLEALEGFLDAPATVIEVAEVAQREALGIQERGQQHVHLAVGSGLANQPCLRGSPLDLIEPALVRGWLCQGDHGLVLAGTQKALHHAPVGAVDAHAEVDSALDQQRCQPDRGIATIQHEQIPPRLQQVQCLEHPLLIIAIFVVVFLEIHPFQDGNGRLSRVLTTLLLLQAGYAYVPYSSLESVVEANKEAYYLALRQTQGIIRSDAPNWQPWLLFFLRSLSEQVRRLEKKVERERIVLAALPELSLRIVEFAREHGRVTMAEAIKLTGASRNTLKQHFRNLSERNHLEQHGSGRGVWCGLK